MTQNKFWLVCRYNEQNTVMIEGVFNNFQGAKELSDYLARTQGYNEFYICESTHHFKADIDVVVTSFEATPEESLAVEPKFKVGDNVNHAVHGVGWIYECNSGLNYTVSQFEDFENAGGFFAREDELTFADIETPKQEFKVGDIVYAQCVYTKKKIKAEITSFFNEKFCYLYILSDDPIDKSNNIYSFSVNDLTHAIKTNPTQVWQYEKKLTTHKENKMTKEELLIELKKLLDVSDPEDAHVRADELLLRYINDDDISMTFMLIEKGYT